MAHGHVVVMMVNSPRAEMTMFFFQAEVGIRDLTVTGVQTCALPISTKAEGIKGEQAREWGLVDAIAPRSGFDAVVRERALARAAESDRPEIGRASCRERGWISVVAGGLK